MACNEILILVKLPAQPWNKKKQDSKVFYCEFCETFRIAILQINCGQQVLVFEKMDQVVIFISHQRRIQNPAKHLKQSTLARKYFRKTLHLRCLTGLCEYIFCHYPQIFESSSARFPLGNKWRYLTIFGDNFLTIFDDNS